MMDSRKESYQSVVETVQDMIESSDPTTAANLQHSLYEMKTAWQEVVDKTAEEGQKLEKALSNAQLLDGNMNDMDSWLTQVESNVVEFGPVSTILMNLNQQREQYQVRLDITSVILVYGFMLMLYVCVCVGCACACDRA